jgi:hypothetical protein
MSYYLFDEDGYVADGPSIQGLEDYVAQNADPVVASFFENGYASSVPDLIAALESTSVQGSVEASRVALLDAAKRANGTLVLSEGLAGERSPRAARAYRPETLVHVAADAHAAKFSVAVRYAFAKGRAAIKPLLKTLGGPGSGNFGHGGRPGEVGGSAAEVVYHGTVNTVIDKILKNGILPANAFEDGLSLPDVIAYASTDRGQAEAYAVYKARQQGVQPVIFEVHVPEDVALQRDGVVVAREEGFKPEWIKAVHEPDVNGKMQRRALEASEGTVVYVVILVSEELRTASRADDLASRAAKAVRVALLDVLPPTLLKAMKAGGDAGIEILGKQIVGLKVVNRDGTLVVHALGDVEGHEFHGNQWTAGTVLGKDGTPLTLYHGSTAKGMTTATLDLNASRVRQATTPTGVAFTSDERAAHGYARSPGKSSEGGNKFGSVVKANLVMKNPLDITKDVKAGQKRGLTFGDAKREALKKLTPEHDGMIFRGDRVNSDEYVAFGKHQIREPHVVRSASHRPESAIHAAADVVHALGDNELRTLKPQAKGQPHSTVGPVKLAFNVSNPKVVAWARAHAAELAKGISETTEQDIRDAVARGMEEGDLGKVYDDVLEAVGSEARADMIARTESMRASNEGQRQSWDQAVEKGLLSGDERREWIATNDSTVCDDCDALDGETADLDGEYPGDGGDGPPLHPNSIAAGVMVEGDAVAATRMSYAGQVREIVTAAGRTLTITPNHAVATIRGFIPACKIEKGEHLLSYSERIVQDGIDPLSLSVHPDAALALPQDEQDRPAKIEQIFSALQLVGKSIVAERFGDEFHGDAAYGNGDIDIVYADVELGNRIEAAFSKQRKSFSFEASDLSAARLRPSLLLDEGLPAAKRAFVPALRPFVDPAFDGRVGSTAQDDAAFRKASAEASAGKSRFIREMKQGLTALISDDQVVDDSVWNRNLSKPHTFKVGTTSQLDATLLELLSQSLTRDAGFVRQLEERFPGTIARDEVVEVRDRDYFGHVYDLSTVSGVIVAEGLIISNCRCTEGISAMRGANVYEVLGGVGSGNFGHAGRPGEVGGSVSDDTYEPPDTSSHPIVRDNGAWGSSHGRSQAITAAAAASMEISGYTHKDQEHYANVANKFLDAISGDKKGSEEVLYHSFENVRGTDFKVGDTMRLPLTATQGGEPGHYGTRLDKVDQRGEPTVFKFEKGTQILAYDKWRKDADGDWPREFKTSYAEAITAGGFKVVGVEKSGSDMFGMQHNSADHTHGPVTGAVVTLRQTETFDRNEGWYPRG